MSNTDWSQLWHDRQLDLNFFQAFYASHNYPKHSHDYYVIAVVDRGSQSFTFAGKKHITPVNGLIFFNPGEVHTGEPIDKAGFGYTAFYPTARHFETAALELGPRSFTHSFSRPRFDDPQMGNAIRSLFHSLKTGALPLEGESKFLWTFIELIKRFGATRPIEPKMGRERQAVKRVRDYINENYTRPVSLAELAEYVNFSRYYLLHIFQAETGMPPYTYLENIRIQQAQKLLSQGEGLSQVAQQVGFGSQSHFTGRFKRLIGVTPGEYARQLRK